MVRFGSSIRERALRDMGREVEVVNFTDDGGRDEYNDPTGFSKTTTTTYAIVEQSQDPEQAGGPDGPDLQTETRIYLPESVEVHQAGEDDAVKATRIKDTSIGNGKDWKVFDVWHDNSGLVMTLCRSQ